MKKYYRILGLSGFFCSFAIFVFGQKNAVITSICEGLTVPWDIEYLPGNQLIFTEIDGRIGKVDLATGKVKTLLQVPDVARELQAGLLGLALHPDFLHNPKIYVAFTSYKSDALVLRIAELIYHLENESLTFSKIIFDDIPAAPTDIGGRLLTTTDGHLFLTVGDLEESEQAQDMHSLNGKVLRLNLDGSIPKDNPTGSAIWAWGLRNSQGLATAYGSVFCTEHGTLDNDELNMLVHKQNNLGWPLIAGKAKTKEEVKIASEIKLNEPLQAWTPTIAPAGLAFYDYTRYPNLKSCFLIANLFDQSLKAVRYDSSSVEITEEFDLVSETAGRLRDVAVAPDGRIFIATSNSDAYGAKPAGSDKILEVLPRDDYSEDLTNTLQELSNIAPTDTLKLDSTTLEIRVLTTKLVHPWDMTWGFDNRIWFTENGGFIKRLDPSTGKLDTILRLSDCHFSWGNPGIYSLAFHPDFPKEPYLFVHYTNSATNSKLVRFRYDFQSDKLVDSVSIIPKIRANESHNGSRIVFTKDKKMFFAMGEAYTPELAQDLASLNGKILRLNLDGSAPDDNPIPGSLIWSYGHRNPQGLALLPNGVLWSSEHGPNNDDELNIIVKGGNYGWPKVQGFCDLRSEKRYCAENQVIEPIIAWTPTVAPCALEYYDNPAIPEWRNSLMQVFLKKGKGKIGQRMTVFKLNEAGTGITSQQDFFVNTYGRLRDVLFSPDGRVFLCTSNMEISGNGKKAIRPGDDKIIELRAK